MNGELRAAYLEASYPLSPLQEGMLFHTLAGRQPGVDLEQLVIELHERLNVQAFQRAWRQIVERHAILRTSFHWEDLDRPRQEVNRQVRLHWEFKDWRGLSSHEQHNRLEAYLRADRRRGFNLTLAPLLRLTLMQIGDLKWRLVWTFHHLLLDGRALVVLLNELFAFYESQCEGYRLEFKAPVAYAEYIRWLHGQDLAPAQTFWRQQLKGFTTPTVLAVGNPAGSARDTASEPAEQERPLSRNLTAALRAFAQQHELTLNTLVQGAWAILLSRYSGHADVVFGAIRACRRGNVTGAESIVGLLINTVPMRIRVERSSGLVEWLRKLREQWVDLRPYEHSPLLQVQEWSEVAPSHARSLFETLLNVQDPSWDLALRAQGGAWRRRRFWVRSQPNYPLAVDVYGGAQMVIKMWYNRRRFDDEVIGRMLGQMKRILEAMTASPHQPVGDVSWLEETEQRQVLEEWNQTEAPYDATRSVVELIEEQAERWPEAVAVVSGEERASYGELNRRANRLARQLVALGVGREALVGVCLERGVDLVVGWLGAWKAGAGYVPLDASYPDERLKYMLADAGVRVLLTQRELAKRLDAEQLRVICLEELPAGEDSNLGMNLSPKNLAYVIYTSGSTGRPKGVEVEHGNLLNLVRWHQHAYGVTPSDRATQLASTAYDACVWELWPYLAAGASIHFPGEPHRLSPRELVKWLSRQSITLCFLPTPIAHAVLHAPWPEETALRALLTGGEKLHRRPSENFPCRLINHYGPTENTVVTTCAPVQPSPDASAPIPIGRPIGNTKVFVLDRDLQPVPVGVPGELCAGGRNLARGYRNQPDLTAEKFIPDPFSNEPGARLYRTGDLVRHGPDGNIEFLGRVDQQVKIRGHRIELGEIEAVLSQHPAVREAAVSVQADDSPHCRLAAYVVPAREHPVTPLQLRDFLKEKLPEYMVPPAYVLLDALPQTPNGKVDRKALPAPQGETEFDEAGALPRSPTEEALAAIWEEVLSVKRVGIRDNFFELGGHSMLATQVMARIYRLFQCDLPVHDLFEFPTVAALAERIDAIVSGPSESPSPPLVPRDHGENRPLSFAQERLWFLEQLEPNRAFNNIPIRVQIEGPLQVQALEESLSELARRHETLRTRFRTVGGQPVAHLGAPTPVSVAMIDLSQVPSASRQEDLERFADEEARRPFDLNAGALWRVKLVRLAAQKHFLILNMHHAVSDGWSLGVIFRELRSLYEGKVESDHAAPLPKLPVQYSDFAVWQREWLQGETLDRQLSFWKQRLSGLVPALNLPTDHPRGPVQSYVGTKIFFALPTSLSKALRALSRREDVTQFMLLLAAFQALLSRYAGQEDIAVGSPIAGRRRVETEGLIGFFANTLVLRTDLSGDPTFRELLHRVRRVALDAYAHQDLPFEKLVDGLQLERNLSHSPLFQVMFIFQRSSLGPMQMGGLTLTPSILDSGSSKFDLTLSLEESGDDLAGFVEYDTSLFEAATITRFLQHYQTLLESIAAEPEQRLSWLALLGAAERKQVLEEWNRTETRDVPEQFVHRLIEQQAAMRPRSVAVVCGDRQLSYAELNQRADLLTKVLRNLGVGSEALVGVFAEPSVETVVGLLATLKAGGAYVPLDPSYPKERLAFMLADAKPLVVLTQEKLLPHLPPFAGQVLCLDPGPGQLSHKLPRLESRLPAVRDLEPANAGTPSFHGRRFVTGENSPKHSRFEPLNDPLSRPADTLSPSEGERDGVRGSVRGEGVGAAPAPQAPSRKMESAPSPDNLAYVIYTSGSTGTPKGVGVSHRGLSNVLCSTRDKLDLSAEDVLLAVTTLSFDIAALELYLPLITGARVELATRKVASDGVQLAGAISASRATVVQATPATWQLLLEAGWEGNLALKILCGGESLPRPLANALLQRGAVLWNLYGPTETTIWSAAHKVQPGADPVSIGGPIANTQLYVLDRHQQPVPIGLPGELHIGGAGLARGYLNRPDLTAEKFVPNPFAGEPRGRLYRTGDRARWLADGRIEFLGRGDHQIKLRGFRIELGEIESALVRHPVVREAVVVVRNNGFGGDRLVAYVTMHSQGRLSFDQFRQWLREKLPDYMVPAIFVLLDAFPLTPNGKIDQKALPMPSQAESEFEGTYAPPTTPLEEVLAEIWAKLFGLERVGIHDNFFKLGGHSLLAVQLIARIQSAFKAALPVRIVFEAPTVEQFAQAMIQLEAAPGQIEKLAQLIRRVKGMTSKEVRKTLRKNSSERVWTAAASQT